MDYVQLKGCGLQVSRICLGTMTLGGQMDESTGLRAVELALDEGVNFFDTANIYTGGASEKILGKAMDGRRDRFILASKVGLKIHDGPNGSGLSRYAVMRAVEDSLRRLGTDYLDIYYLHAPDRDTPPEETLATMDCLVRSGKVRYVGASNFAAWQLCRLSHLARENGYVPPVMTQNVYNLLTRGIEQELIPFLKEYGMSLVVYNPLAGGLLTDKYAEKKKLENARFAVNETYKDRYWNDDNLWAWDELHAAAKVAGIRMDQLAMRWLAATGNADVIITGFTSVEQLELNLAALDGEPLPADVLALCDKVWDKLSGSRFQYNR